jgi:hypothetical protein
VSLRRAHWEDLSKNLHSAIQTRTGAVLAAQTVPKGLNSEIAALLSTSQGKIFIKGLRSDPDLPLKRAEQRWTPYMDDASALPGDALLHTDVNPFNVLINGTARIIDWAWPTRGAAWIEPACFVLRLMAAGPTPEEAEAWAQQASSWDPTPRKGDAFVAASAPGGRRFHAAELGSRGRRVRGGGGWIRVGRVDSAVFWARRGPGGRPSRAVAASTAQDGHVDPVEQQRRQAAEIGSCPGTTVVEYGRGTQIMQWVRAGLTLLSVPRPVPGSRRL